MTASPGAPPRSSTARRSSAAHASTRTRSGSRATSPPLGATYRLQLRREFDFDAAAGLVPYLARLGISHVYSSPITQARPGSSHGYDVTDPTRLSEELGGEAGFARLVAALRQHAMGLIIDFVPNHMAASLDNPWWADVLRRGQASQYASTFDIDWQDGKVTLPWLSGPLDPDDIRRRFARGELPNSDGGAAYLRGGAVDIEELLALQHYRLIDWHDAPQQINYRRFFDINDLVGIRVEDPAVFERVHGLIKRLVDQGAVQGLRLDHIDGLRDPMAYCHELQALLPGTPIWVEKILDFEEDMPPFPGVLGTTGYEIANLLCRCFIDRDGLARLDALWREICGGCDGAAMRDAAKRQILHQLFPGAFAKLVQLGDRSAAALEDHLVGLRVYRSYEDRADEFTARLQQLSGPLMAKAVEDTLFYRDFRLLALNEVGGDPQALPLSTEDFHSAVQRRMKTQKLGLNATATHDTKRGEDARLRIAAASMLAECWPDVVKSWLAEASIIAPEHRYMLYQAMLCWPMQASDEDFVKRTQQFAIKALREGKQHSSWTAPNNEYEAAVEKWIAQRLGDARWRAEFGAVAERAARLGAAASLAQLVLKATLPGVPDFYQGCELWDLSYVDPDNRRPVDYARRQRMLDANAQPDWTTLARDWRSGAIKLALTHKLLMLRRQHATLLAQGDYQPLQPGGRDADRVLAFSRAHEGKRLTVAVLRDFRQATDSGRRWFDGSELDVEIGGERVRFELPAAIWLDLTRAL